jgi:aldose 1-epimerase
VLHSGDGGTADRVWSIAAQSENSLTLEIDLADGLGGFPGNRRITATWTVEGRDLTLDIRATTDALTLMNIAHHPYWALDGPEAGRDGHVMESPAPRYTPSTSVFTPTGDIVSVAGSDYDFRQPARPLPTLDANLCLADADREVPTLAATLTSDGGRRLDVLTTAPGIQVFTGKPYGIALEPQLWPNAPAHAGFPSITLSPDETFWQRTIYRFSEA